MVKHTSRPTIKRMKGAVVVDFYLLSLGTVLPYKIHVRER
jgi:hypothetical protein